MSQELREGGAGGNIRRERSCKKQLTAKRKQRSQDYPGLGRNDKNLPQSKGRGKGKVCQGKGSTTIEKKQTSSGVLKKCDTAQ